MTTKLMKWQDAAKAIGTGKTARVGTATVPLTGK
jgi:hypothetical protein